MEVETIGHEDCRHEWADSGCLGNMDAEVCLVCNDTRVVAYCKHRLGLERDGESVS